MARRKSTTALALAEVDVDPLNKGGAPIGPSEKSTDARSVPSNPTTTTTSHGRHLSLKRPKRENARQEMERERKKESGKASRVESSRIDLGGEQTPIVHATNHSLKATSVTIASAGL
ncbi:unnamed protein product [Lasius platythorax]|uniref:Uncharacterized protein n=1 Tax=Lasius platythorax TaxID=488582 RepID=A0AAV2P0V6_9HYME